MTSSRFKSNIPFRPTPQTCYPPPPPPVDPGFVPCFGHHFGQYASMSGEGSFTPNGGLPNTVLLPKATNIIKLARGPNFIQWSTYLTSAQWINTLIEIRCVSTTYGFSTWETRLAGRVLSPSNEIMSADTGWAPNPSATVSFDGHARQVAWDQVTSAILMSPLWKMDVAHCILREIPDISRSRPPNPPIPALA